jgi:dimethylargininase
MATIALTRPVSPSLQECALSFRARRPIDLALAATQHHAYEDLLRAHGIAVVPLAGEPDLPDAVFVEDTVVAVDEIAVLTRPALESRRREVASMAEVVDRYRPLARIEAPGTLDGGDVLRIGETVYVGLSARTNQAGVESLRRALTPYGYDVIAVRFSGCLHLKSACTDVAERTMLANPAYVDTAQFPGVEVIAVAPQEEEAANALRLGDTVVLPSNFPGTAARLTEVGFCVETIDVSELQKAEAGLTCCSVLLTV